MDDYGRASRHKINRDKSLFFLGKFTLHLHSQVQALLGYFERSIPFNNYLGVPIFKRCLKGQHLQALVNKVCLVFIGWHEKILSLVSRAELIKYVIQNLLIHSFNVYYWPRLLLQTLQKWSRNFLLFGNVLHKKLALISWDQCCLPKEKMRFGIGRLDFLNSLCLLKLFWNLRVDNSLCAQFMQARYVLDARRKYLSSSLYSRLHSMIDSCDTGLVWVIKYDQWVRFWHDCWLHSPILSLDSSLRFSSLVSSIISDGQWYILTEFYEVFLHLKDPIHGITLPHINYPDRLVWKSSKDGNLTLKDSFDYLRIPSVTQPWCKVLWKNFISLRFVPLVWHVLLHRIPSNEFLR